MTNLTPSRFVALAAVLAAGVVTGCGINTKDSGTPTVSIPQGTGTTTTRTVARKLPTRPSGVVAVSGDRQNSLTKVSSQTFGGVRTAFDGTGTGIAFQRLCRGEIDIAETNRAPGPRELAICERYGVELVDPIEVAADAIVIATKNESDVGGDCLQKTTVKEIFRSGSPIDSWDQVGFDEIPLHTTGRDEGTNIFDFFSSSVLGVDTNPSLGDFRADYRVRNSDDRVRYEVTSEQRIKKVNAELLPLIRRLEASESTRRNHEIAAAIRRAKRILQAQIDRENRVRAARLTRLTSAQKTRIRVRNAQRFRKVVRDAQNGVIANFSTPRLTSLRLRYKRELAAADVAGTVGYFRFSYYELYENQLRPMEIWDPDTARTALSQSGVAVTPREGTDDPKSPKANDRGPVVDPDRTPWCVFPSQLTITNGSYPLTRPILLYTTKLNIKRAEVKSFLRTYMNRAQDIARQNRLVAITEDRKQSQLELIDNNGVAPAVTTTTSTTSTTTTPGQTTGTVPPGTSTTSTTSTTQSGVAGVGETPTTTTTTSGTEGTAITTP